jgi:hypothetical protein
MPLICQVLTRAKDFILGLVIIVKQEINKLRVCSSIF